MTGKGVEGGQVTGKEVQGGTADRKEGLRGPGGLRDRYLSGLPGAAGTGSCEAPSMRGGERDREERGNHKGPAVTGRRPRGSGRALRCGPA